MDPTRSLLVLGRPRPVWPARPHVHPGRRLRASPPPTPIGTVWL